MLDKNKSWSHHPLEATNFFLIGIGGIGVSALARLLHHLKKNVSGSDVQETEITDALQHHGIHVFIGEHHSSNISSDIDVVIYSAAVPTTNPERQKAESLGIPTFSYAEMLGHVMKQYFTIAISGTHGKTTTTALIGHMLVTAHLDPTIIVGSLSKNLKNSNERLGKGRFLVIEADEYKGSFLNYHPDIAVILNIEADHLDYYRDIHHIIGTFKEFSLRVKSGGFIVANGNDKNVAEAIKDLNQEKIIFFGTSTNQFAAEHIELLPKGTLFSLSDGSTTFPIKTSLLGMHNVSNILAAVAVAAQLKIPFDRIQKGIETFKGTWRRFDVVGVTAQRTIIDDYAHHPTEIKACIASLRQAYPNKKITFIFQPHHENRFSALFDQFVSSFDGVDQCFILEIYYVAGRANVVRSDSSQRLVEALQHKGIPATFFNNEEALQRACQENTQPHDVLAFVGAGDIIRIRQSCLDYLQKHS